MYFTFGYDWISSYDMVKKKGGRETNTITYHMDVILFVDSWLLGRCKCKFDDTAPLRIYLLYPHYPVNTTNSQQTQKLHLALLYTHSLQKDKRKNYAVILQALSEPFIVCNIRLCTIHYPTIESRELKKNRFSFVKKNSV